MHPLLVPVNLPANVLFEALPATGAVSYDLEDEPALFERLPLVVEVDACYATGESAEHQSGCDDLGAWLSVSGPASARSVAADGYLHVTICLQERKWSMLALFELAAVDEPFGYVRESRWLSGILHKQRTSLHRSMYLTPPVPDADLF